MENQFWGCCILGEVMSDFKYNWSNDTYKHSKIVLIQQIKKEAADSIVLYRGQISKILRKRTAFHSDKSVKDLLKDLQAQFTDNLPPPAHSSH